MSQFILENFNLLLKAWIILGIFTFLFLIISKIRAPYGRHSSKGWGIMTNNTWAWFWMEFPALVVMPVLSLLGPNELNPFSILLISIWFIHYFNRVIIFPLRIKTKGKKMPISIAFSAFFFNIFNGFFNGYYVGFIMDQGSIYNYNVLIGLIIFVFGMAININSDNRLISLRKNSEGYKIPYGNFFNYVSCPNYMGEIIEWIGFSIIAISLPALSFTLWTCFNLIPRALNHHRWYLENFDNYPENRKAIIPFIL
tara:strand:- start:986 stop:1747 length:762 start_codon:yes stop_codon:yes gene_type:complete